MKILELEYIKGSHKEYPFDGINIIEMHDMFKGFHKILQNDGYNIKAINIAEKDNGLFWILLDESKKHFRLEHYANIL